MNLDFWVTIAQISATFTGLVFVGFSIYLKGIREAIDSIDQLFGSNNGLQEKSSYLITSLALSNITFLLLPLITALSILSAQNGRSLLYPYIITNIFLVVFFWFLHSPDPFFGSLHWEIYLVILLQSSQYPNLFRVMWNYCIEDILKE